MGSKREDLWFSVPAQEFPHTSRIAGGSGPYGGAHCCTNPRISQRNAQQRGIAIELVKTAGESDPFHLISTGNRLGHGRTWRSRMHLEEKEVPVSQFLA